MSRTVHVEGEWGCANQQWYRKVTNSLCVRASARVPLKHEEQDTAKRNGCACFSECTADGYARTSYSAGHLAGHHMHCTFTYHPSSIGRCIVYSMAQQCYQIGHSPPEVNKS